MSYITYFTAITISNENLFNYNVVDLVATYNFHIYFIPSKVIWKFWNFEIENLNHVFGYQNNLTWKNLQLQSCWSDWDLQLLYRPFLIWDDIIFQKSHIQICHKGDTPWCCTSPISSQRWRALMKPVTFDMSKPRHLY